MDVNELIENIFKEYPELNSLSGKEKRMFLEEFERKINASEDIPALSYDFDIPDSLLLKKDEYIDGMNQKYRIPAENALKFFAEYCASKKIIPLKASAEQMGEFIKDCYKNGKSQSTTRVMFSRINQYYKYLVSEKILGYDENPCEKITVSEIDYNSSKNFIPSVEEIKKIINDLPVYLAAVVAAAAEESFTLKELQDAEFRTANVYLDVYSEDGTIPVAVNRVSYFYRKKNLWVYDLVGTDRTFSYGELLSLNDRYTTHSSWYSECMEKFAVYMQDNYGYDKENDWNDCVFVTNNINLHSYENMIVKKMDEMYRNGEISYPYKLKNFRLYKIACLYEETRSIGLIQKRLGHTSLNTTRRFLQSCGIKLYDE